MSRNTKDNKIISIIVAAYNVGDFIVECLRSVTAQNGFAENVKLIVIIDGSTDQTEAEVKGFVSKRTGIDISVITQENSGLSAARNEGLRHVDTEYVTFLDGDDFWLHDYLYRVLPKLSSLRYDIIEYDLLLTTESGLPIAPLGATSARPSREQRIGKFDFLRKFRCYSCSRIFRTSLIKKKPFPLGVRYEDVHTTPWHYYLADEIMSIGLPLLAYRQREGSIVSTPSLDDVSSLNRAALEAMEAFHETGDTYWSEVAIRSLQQSCSRIIALPFSAWPSAVRMTNRSVDITLIRGQNLIRKIQLRYTFLYVILLFFKRGLIDKIARKSRSHLTRRKFSEPTRGE